MIELPKKKYQIIYADPPWSYKDKRERPGPKGNKAGSAAAHYPTMSLQEIMDLPVQDIASDPCMLFIWVTWPLLPMWLPVINAWGFQYKTLAFNWVKQYPKSGKLCIGAGAYTRSNSEVCLLGVKGKAGSMVIDRRICNVIVEQDEEYYDISDNTVVAPRGVHSAKPTTIRNKIVRLVGDRPRIELFARSSAEGWDVWGNEVNNDDVQDGESLISF